MPFDPTAAFTVDSEPPTDQAGFDPSKPFTVEGAPAASNQPMDIGAQLRTAYDFQVNPSELFKPFEGARQVIESIIPSPTAETEAMRLTGIKHVPTTAETVALKGKGALETIASPGGVLLGAAGVLAPEIVGPVMAATALPQVGQGVSEIAQGKVAAGAADLALAAPMLAGAAAPFAIREAPITARVMESGKEALSKAVEAGGDTAAKSEASTQVTSQSAKEVPVQLEVNQPSEVWKINTSRYLDTGYDKASLGETEMVNLSDISPSQEHGSTRPELVKAFAEGKPVTPVVLERDAAGEIRIVDGSYRVNSAEEAGVKQIPAKFVKYEDGLTREEAESLADSSSSSPTPTAEVSFPEPSIEPARALSEGANVPTRQPIITIEGRIYSGTSHADAYNKALDAGERIQPSPESIAKAEALGLDLPSANWEGGWLVNGKPIYDETTLEPTTSVWHQTAPENVTKIQKEGYRPSENGFLGPGIYTATTPNIISSKLAGKPATTLQSEVTGKLLNISGDAPNVPLEILRKLFGDEEGSKYYDAHHDKIWREAKPNWDHLRELVEEKGYVGYSQADEGYRRVLVFRPQNIKAQAPISAGPGAASPGDVPGGSQLAQLTKAIEPTVPVEKPLLTGVKNDFTRAYEQLTDKAESALTRLKSFGSQAMAALKGEAKWTDFKDALGKFSGELNRNSYELQQFTKEVRRVIPDRLRREAIVNWIQADGDTALLRERESISKPDLRSGYKVAQTLTPDEMTLAGNVRSYLDAKLQEGIDAGLLKAGIENYVTQLWDRPNPIVNKLIGEVASGKLSTNFKFARKRIFDSYFEGEQAGFKPKLKDIGALTAIYDQSFSRAIAGRKLIKALHEGKATDGLPLVEVSGVSNLLSEGGEPQAVLIKPKVKPADLAGYKPIDHPALRGWKWAGTDENGAPILYQGDMVVHPEIYGHLKNVLSSSALRQNAFFRGVLEAQAILKQSKLALSGFHFTQEGTHAAAHRVNPFAPGKVDFSIPDQSALVDHGLQVADYHAYQAFSEGVSGAGSIYERIPTVGKWLTRYNEYLFQEYIPRLKMSMAMDALERNRERFAGKLSDDQILEMTANQSNAAFGALNYDMLGRNKTLQDFIRMAALAPDFLEARFRFAAQALTKTGTEQRVALALQAATLYTGARILNQALDGDPHWEPKYAFDVVYNKRQYGIRSVVEDAMHFATDPAKFISNRMAPIMKAAVEFTTGRDWRGVKRTSLEQLKDLADWLLPITADRQADRTKLDTALAASGVTVRSATAQQRLYDQLRQFKESNNLISRDEKIGMTSPSEYGPLRNALTVANDAAAKREYEALLHPTDGTKPKTPTQIREHFISSVRAPFSGSQRVEMLFLKSLDKKGNDLYLEARQERKELAQKFIEKQRQWMSEGKK